MPSVILSVSVVPVMDGIWVVCDNLYSTSNTPRIPTAPRSRIGLAMAMMATIRNEFDQIIFNCILCEYR